VRKSSGEEPAGGHQMPFLRHQHVNDLPELVDRAVEVDPVACQNSIRGYDQVFSDRIRLRAGTR
jgi:hypothetical protein